MDSFRHAFNGIAVLLKEEPNARIHFLSAVLAVLSGFILGLNSNEWLWIILSICLVFCAELFNTAIENICDFISPDIHPKIKIIKDLSAAAVLITAAFAIITAAIIFTPKILNLL